MIHTKQHRYWAPMKGKHHSFISKEKTRNSLIGHSVSETTKKKIRKSLKGKSLSEETKQKMKGRVPWNRGIPCSEQTKRKMRLSMTRTLKKRYGTMMFPMYNPIACHQIDNYGKEHGYAFRHAQNGGEFFIKELGYWVDGYDAKKNVVIEYYEVQHNKCRERDNRRKQEIINHLHCTFIEMWYDGKSLITS